MTNGFAPVGNGELYYEVAGDGAAVVLSHAGIADSRMWDRQMAPFAEHYQVIRYDVRGFGRSSSPEADFAPHDDLAALLGRLQIDRAAVVGVSISGGIAVDFALAYPQMTWALVPVAAALDGFDYWKDPAMKRFDEEEAALLKAGDIDRAVELNVAAWVDGPGRTPDEVDSGVRDKIALMQRDIFERGQGEGKAKELDPPAIERLEEIRAPTLALAGDQDFAVIQEITSVIASRVPGARKAVISNAAHVPSMERPEEFNRIVLEFLDSVRA